MKSGRPAKIRMRKAYKRRRYGAAVRGGKNPKQLAATMGNRARRRRRRR